MDLNIINVSVAFIVKDNKVLVAQKKDDSKYPLKWEFPGGKLVGEEKFDEALIRELKEELNINIKTVQELGSVEYRDGNDAYILMFIISDAQDIDNIKLNAHKDYKFCTLAELKSLDMLEPDKNFVSEYAEQIAEYIG